MVPGCAGSRPGGCSRLGPGQQREGGAGPSPPGLARLGPCTACHRDGACVAPLSPLSAVPHRAWPRASERWDVLHNNFQCYITNILSYIAHLDMATMI